MNTTPYKNGRGQTFQLILDSASVTIKKFVNIDTRGNVLKFFCPQFMNVRNKLECLFLIVTDFCAELECLLE